MNTPIRLRRQLRRGAVALGAAALLTTVLTAGTNAPRPPKPCTPAWTVEEAPNQASAKVSAVEVFDRNNVVFAENRADSGTGTFSWDGTAMRQSDARIPAPVSVDQALLRTGSLSYDSPDSGWALLHSDLINSGLSMARPMARWDGTRWSMVPTAVSPRPAEGLAEVQGVASVAPDDAWAVGNVGVTGALLEHWDGERWTIVDHPAANAPYSVLQRVVAISPTDIWAAGSGRDAEGRTGALVLHYDGTTWKQVTMPAELAMAQFFVAKADDAGNVWLGGQTGNPADPNTWQPVLARWDGEQWTSLPEIPVGWVNAGYVRDAYVADTDDIWVVTYPSGLQSILAHWDGTTWTEVKPQGAQPAEYIYDYTALDGAGPNEVWAVGEAATIEPPSGPIPLPQVRSGQLLGHLTCGGK